MSSKDKTPLKSKKFIVFLLTFFFICISTVSALVGILISPESSSSIVNLITVALASMSGAAGLHISGQSAVDWKINSEHKSTQENTIDVKKQIIDAHKNMEMQYGDEPLIDWDKHERIL